MKEIYEHVLEMMKQGEQGVLVTVTEVSGSVPRHAGSKMVVHADGRIFGSIGGGKLEADAIKEALQMMGKTQPEKKRIQLTEDRGSLCGGQLEILFEPFGQSERLIIFGAGHIAHALAPLAKKAGFTVTVADNRPQFANRERFPDADEILIGEFGELLPRITLGENTYLVIVTHGHKHDEEILEYCVSREVAYLGMIGSKRKTLTILRNLEEKGIPRERLQRVRSPIGLRIGAETPFEIAVSILAEIIATRKGVDVGNTAMKLDLKGKA